MNPETYIASGILEQYVLGKLDPQEMAEVERYADQHPAVREEIDAIETALQSYALLHGKTPPPGVLSATLQALERRTSSVADQLRSGRVIMAIVLALLAFATAGWLVAYRTQDTQSIQIAELSDALNERASACDSLQARYDLLLQEADFLRDPATRGVIMQGTDLSPQSIAAVYYNANNRQSYLNVRSLPIPAADQQYQLWAIVDGSPVDMGVFELDTEATGLQAVPFVQNAQAFAVTLEPRGGSASPTLDQMYVIGNT